MRMMTKNALTIALACFIGSLGCGEENNSLRDGGTADGGMDANADGPTLFGLSTGDSCFDIVSIEPGFNDGCELGVDGADLIGAALPVNYVMSTATLTVGTSGSLGSGPIAFNKGTLTREGNPSDSENPACAWHQTNTSMVTLTATNEFDIAVTEVQDQFAVACDVDFPGGTCTSTWTWHMKKGTKTPPDCD